MPIDYKKYPALVCRGIWGNKPVWQNDDGQIHCAETGQYMASSYVGDVWQTVKQPLVKIVLTIAHLDHDITNNNYINLKALCQRCHLKHDNIDNCTKAATTRQQKRKQYNLFNN